MSSRAAGSGAQHAPGKSLFVALASALALAAVPSAARAKTILVVAAHPDDEVIMAAGRVSAARSNGDTIKVVIMTNGDIDGVTSGLQREGESVQSALTLGLTEQDVIFLGYPDGSTRQIYDSASGTRVFTSAANQTATYGNRGLGGMEYHRYLYGVHGSYNRNTMLGDFQALLTNFQPDEVYTHSNMDAHGDHEATVLFLTEALLTLKRSGVDLHTKVYQSIVWMYAQAQGVAIGAYGNWPQISASGWTPLVPILPWSTGCVPGDCLDLITLEWSRVKRFVQPPSMQVTDVASNLKALALPFDGAWFISWVRRDEFFWLDDYGTNLATTAQVTASSQDSAGGHPASMAVDGITGSIPDYPDIGKEWVTLGQRAGAWIQLDWSAPVRIAQVNLYDRLDPAENIQSGTLTFSDGSSVSVGALPPTGRVLPVTFSPRVVSWVRFTVNQAQGTATGLVEIQALGAPASSTANVPPHVIQGPIAAAETIPASQSTTLSVAAHDLDGDPLQYQWSAEGGFIQGNGASATFTPPAVTTDTYVAVTVNVLDGRGGVASNSTFIRVTPAPANSISLSPAALFGGDGAQGTVLLGTAAPAGGTVVPLSSSNAAVATVPASVTVPAGGTSSTFAIGTSPVAASTSVTVSAAFAGGTRGALLTVVPQSVAALTLNPANVLGGSSGQGTVTLPVVAGAQGVVVQLSSSDPAHAAVPASVAVPAGAASAAFAIATTAVPATTPVTISATYGTTASAVLTVGPLGLASLALDPATVVGGSSAQGTVWLNGPAPGGGATVALSSGNPAIAAVPASATIPAGATSAAFAIATSAVATDTVVTISAAFAGSGASAPLTVSPNLPNPNLLQSPEQIGATPWGTLGDLALTLNYASSPDGTQHATRAVSSGGGHALRQGVALTPGSTYTLSFFARNDGGSAASYSVFDQDHFVEIVPPTPYLSQLSGSAYARVGVTFTVPAGCTNVWVYPLRDSGGPVDVLLWGAKLEVGSSMTPYQGLVADSVTMNPATVVSGGSAQGTVVLANAAPAGGTSVALASSNPAVASVPVSVTVPAGASSATFTATTGAVSATVVVTISAAFASGTRTTTLSVTPLAVSSLGVSPASVVGGAGATGTVTLSSPAPAGGATVLLSSSSTSVLVPASVSVAAGATSATFAVATTAVTAVTSATITATYGSSTQTATLTVAPVSLSALTLGATSVVEGDTPTATVTLGSATPSDATVALTSSSSAAIVPPSVVVPAGATTATFAVSTGAVSATTSATLTATYAGTSRTATLSVRALSVTFSPASVLGGATSTGSLTLSASVPSPVTVTLSSSVPAAVVPASATIPAGATTATFPVTTTPVAATTVATISATYGTVASTGTLTVTPVAFSAFTRSPTAVVEGDASTGTVTLGGAAPAPGVTIALSSNNAAATVPASVTVPAGATTATFPIATSAVSAATSVTLSATYGSTTRTVSLAIRNVTVSLSPATVGGGNTSTATVRLSNTVTTPTDATLSTSNTAVATVPATVTIAAGATTATFPVTTFTVTATTAVTVTSTHAGIPASASLSVRVISPSAVSLGPNSLVGGAPSTGTVTLNYAAPAGGYVAALASSRTAVATVPASVTVPAGSTSATFPVTTFPVAANTTSSISASGAGVTRSATLTVTAPAASSLSLSPATVTSGQASTGTVTISGAAPAGGRSVSLSSNNAAASVPATVVVPAGATAATFVVTAGTVTASTSVGISATAGGATASATLTVNP
jgi:LmbE family N-acetylglucosaminyl deacetylase